MIKAFEEKKTLHFITEDLWLLLKTSQKCFVWAENVKKSDFAPTVFVGEKAKNIVFISDKVNVVATTWF